MDIRIKRVFILPLIFLLMFSSVDFVYADGDISIKNWKIDAQILENGDLKIVEDINFYFNSDFNGVFRDINLNETDGIKDLKVEGLDKNNSVYKLVDSAEDGDLGVYTIDKEGDNLNIKIYSPSEYEEKTFRFSYTLKTTARKYKDVSELYHKFVGDNNSTYIENLDISVRLPQKKTDEVRLFAHGHKDIDIGFEGEDIVKLHTDYLEDYSMIEARIVMPADFLPDLQTRTDEDMLDIILEQEESYLKEQARSRTIKAKREKGVNFLTIIALISGAILAIFSYFKNKHNIAPYQEQLKGNLIYLPPAIITNLTRAPFDSNMIITTLYHLSHKGFISIEDDGFFKKKGSKKEVENFKITNLNKDRSDLLKHEVFLLDWFFKDIAMGNSFTSEDLYEYTRKNSSKFNQKFTDWCKEVSKDLETLELKDNSKVKLGIFLIIISIAFLVLSIFNIIIYRNIVKGIGLLVLFILLLVFGIELTQRLTDLGHIQYTKLMDFKKDVIKERIDIRDERLLIVAMALGIKSDKLMKFENNFSDFTSFNNTSWLYWYFIFDSKGENVFANSLTASSGIQNINSTNPSSPGGSSGGGGAGGF